MLLHNILGTHQRGAHPQNQKDDPPLVNVQLLCGADENCSNFSRAAKQQKDLLNNYFKHLGALPGGEDLKMNH